MELAEQIKNRFPSVVLEAKADKGSQTLYVRKEGIKTLALSLKNEPDFQLNVLIDLFAVDYLHWEEKENRFEVIYNLYSLTKGHRLFVKAPVSETDPAIDSVMSIWPAANWFEREVWDMMGIVFKGHSNLKRILMYEGFDGHPLRKDYPYNKRQPLVNSKNETSK